MHIVLLREIAYPVQKIYYFSRMLKNEPHTQIHFAQKISEYREPACIV